MTNLHRVFDGVTRIGIDTSPFIYLIEAHTDYFPLVAPLFEQLDSGAVSAVTSTITVAEVTVLPFRLGRADLSQQYLDLLLNSVNLDVLPIDVHAAQVAAELRARFRIRLPDALQLAVAIAARCDAFLTNDVALKQVSDIRVLTLADLVG